MCVHLIALVLLVVINLIVMVALLEFVKREANRPETLPRTQTHEHARVYIDLHEHPSSERNDAKTQTRHNVNTVVFILPQLNCVSVKGCVPVHPSRSPPTALLECC